MSASLRAVCALVLPALLLPACDVKVGEKGVSLDVSAGRASDTWSRTYTVAAGGRLEAVNVNGGIEVTAAPAGQLEMTVERQVRSLTDEAARDRMAQTEVFETSTPGSVTVRVQDKRDAERKRRGGPGGLSSKMTIKLPPGLTVSLSTENGPIQLEQVDGRFTLSTANASIDVTGLSGGVTATAVNGRVQIAMKSVTDPIGLTVVNGAVGLTLPDATKARLTASALNGSINIDDALKFDGARGGAGGFPQQRVEGSLNGGGPEISIQVTNGGVRIRSASSPEK